MVLRTISAREPRHRGNAGDEAFAIVTLSTWGLPFTQNVGILGMSQVSPEFEVEVG